MGLQHRIGAAAAIVLMLAAAACSGDKIDDATPVDNVYAPPPLTAEPTDKASPSPSPSASPSTGSGRGSSAASQPKSGQPAAPSNSVPRNSSGKVICPTGSVSAVATSLSSDENEIDGSDDSEWEVVVRGTVTNSTSRQIHNVQVHVDLNVPNSDGGGGTTTVGAIGQGTSATWREDTDIEGDEEPELEHASVEVRGWSWGDQTLDAACPRV